MLRWAHIAARGVAVGVVLSAAAGCSVDAIDHGAYVCAPETCDGCCTANGRCLAGTNVFACGAAGLACQRCDVDQTCSAGACVAASPLQDGGDGGNAPCSAENCDGCCEGGACVASSAQGRAACGLGGRACAPCEGTCSAGVCSAGPACALVTIPPSGSTAGQLDFGQWPVGGRDTQIIRWRNDGDLACRLSDFWWLPAADQGAFRFGEDPKAVTIEPGGTIQFPVEFRPYKPWVWQEDQNAFAFLVNGGAQVGLVKVTGEGIESAVPAIGAVIPERVDFGDVQVGCQSQARSVLVVNTMEGQALTVTSVTVPAGFTLDGPAPASVPANGSVQLQVRFAPAAAGAAFGTLLVEHDLGSAAIALSGTAVTTSARTETIPFPYARSADVLFVVHGSKSMADTQDEFPLAAKKFVDAASLGAGFWHAGVIRTDATQYSAGLLHGLPEFVTPATPNAGSTLAKNLTVGEVGPLDMSFEAVRLSLIPWEQNDRGDAGTVAPTRNPGFRRPGARLAVVLVSDAEDHSGVSVTEFSRFLRAVSGVPYASERLRVYALAGGSGCRAGGTLEEVISPIGGQCLCALSSMGCATSNPSVATVPTVVDAFESFAQHLFQPLTEVLLSQKPDPLQPHAVTVDQSPLVQGTQYQFDPTRSAVKFSMVYLPQQGQEITVTYHAQCNP